MNRARRPFHAHLSPKFDHYQQRAIESTRVRVRVQFTNPHFPAATIVVSMSHLLSSLFLSPTNDDASDALTPTAPTKPKSETSTPRPHVTHQWHYPLNYQDYCRTCFIRQTPSNQHSICIIIPDRSLPGAHDWIRCGQNWTDYICKRCKKLRCLEPYYDRSVTLPMDGCSGRATLLVDDESDISDDPEEAKFQQLIRKRLTYPGRWKELMPLSKLPLTSADTTEQRISSSQVGHEIDITDGSRSLV